MGNYFIFHVDQYLNRDFIGYIKCLSLVYLCSIVIIRLKSSFLRQLINCINWRAANLITHSAYSTPEWLLAFKIDTQQRQQEGEHKEGEKAQKEKEELVEKSNSTIEPFFLRRRFAHCQLWLLSNAWLTDWWTDWLSDCLIEWVHSASLLQLQLGLRLPLQLVFLLFQLPYNPRSLSELSELLLLLLSSLLTRDRI